jgi:hypothetical protein
MEGGASKGSTGAVAWASLFLSWLCLREEERKQQRKEKERRKEKKKRKKGKKIWKIFQTWKFLKNKR